MFGIFKKKKDAFDAEKFVREMFDAEKFVREMMEKKSQLNTRDEMEVIIGDVLRTRGYQEFLDGMIFLNSEFRCGWAKEDGTFVATINPVGSIISAVLIKEAILNNELCNSAEDELELIASGDISKEVGDIMLGSFCWGICEMFAERCAEFRALPKM